MSMPEHTQADKETQPAQLQRLALMQSPAPAIPAC